MKKLTTILLIVSLLALFTECTKSKPETKAPPAQYVAETDSALFAKTISMADVYYYKGSDSILPSSAASAHKAFFRVRFNTIAKNALTDNGKLPAGNTFPVGSLIVKELHSNAAGTGLIGYAVMEKLPDDPNASEQWVWAEYFSTTTPRGILVGGKGSECVNCHSTDSRDRVRLFNLFP